MAHATPSRHCRQARRLRDDLAQAPGLPFADLLPASQVQQALNQEGVCFRDRLFTPLVTLWVFLSQALDPDGSCRAALARFLAWRAARGLPPCAGDTSAYCKARARLPEAVLARLTRQTGRQAQDAAPAPWRWEGRTVKVVDGTTVSMPDTPENQAAYPQGPAQPPGLGFPIARLVVLFSLAVGTALDAALGRYQGKGTGETSLFRALHDHLEDGDILLADRCFSSYWELALVRQRGADLVTRLHQRRRADFRRGRRLGREDHVVSWDKPPRPDWMDEATYATLPETLEVREVRVQVGQRGFRTRVFVAVTTLLDGAAFPRADVAVLYRMRWLAELDLRALQEALRMDVLRCKSPEMVRKEVWAHLLAYNLVRGLMAQAAREAKVLPVQLSFTGAVQAVNAFAAVWQAAEPGERAGVAARLRALVAEHRVGDRPNRSEPRARKRRPKAYPLLKHPRDQARKLAGKGRYD
jgi:Transposase DDE domain